jgi:hypothetical protein
MPGACVQRAASRARRVGPCHRNLSPNGPWDVRQSRNWRFKCIFESGPRAQGWRVVWKWDGGGCCSGQKGRHGVTNVALMAATAAKHLARVAKPAVCTGQEVDQWQAGGRRTAEHSVGGGQVVQKAARNCLARRSAVFHRAGLEGAWPISSHHARSLATGWKNGGVFLNRNCIF